MPSRVEIQCECAFTYMNAVFRKNLTDVFSVDATAVDTASDTGRRTRRWHDRARFLPDDRYMHLGRERPPRSEAWGRVPGGGRGGRSRPRCPPRCCVRPRSRIRAAKSAARQTETRTRSSQRTSPNRSTGTIIFSSAPRSPRNNAPRGGTTAPRSVVPLHFSLFTYSRATRGREMEDLVPATTRSPVSRAKAAFGRASQPRQSTGAHLARRPRDGHR